MSVHNFLLFHLRGHVENSGFVRHHGFQTPRNTLALVFDILHETRMKSGADLGGGCRGCAPPPPSEMTCGFLIQLVFCQTMWFIGVEVEQEKSAPPPKINPGSAHGNAIRWISVVLTKISDLQLLGRRRL